MDLEGFLIGMGFIVIVMIGYFWLIKSHKRNGNHDKK